MAEPLSSITEAELINELPEKVSIDATDLYLIQTSVQSFKLEHQDLVANLADNTTIIVNGSNKLTVSTDIIQSAYPIGSIYLNASDSTNPASLLGFGTWVKFSDGRVLIGEGSGTDDNANNETFTIGLSGGEYEHTLTEAELPDHNHTITSWTKDDGSSNSDISGEGSGSQTVVTNTSTVGGDQSHNNIQPYITVYMWKRTA